MMDMPEWCPEDIWETAYDTSESFSHLYGCDENERWSLTLSVAEVIWNERSRHKEIEK